MQKFFLGCNTIAVRIAGERAGRADDAVARDFFGIGIFAHMHADGTRRTGRAGEFCYLAVCCHFAFRYTGNNAVHSGAKVADAVFHDLRISRRGASWYYELMNAGNLKKIVLYGMLALGIFVLIIFLYPNREEELSFTPISPQEGSESVSEVSELSPSPTESFRVEVVSTPASRQKGLSGRKEIPQDYGMLFIFPTLGAHGFWMKDMHVAIDIIWLSDTGNILGIEENVSPDTYPNVFYPPEPVRYVLETRAGEARRKGWSEGELVPINLPSSDSVSE